MTTLEQRIVTYRLAVIKREIDTDKDTMGFMVMPLVSLTMLFILLWNFSKVISFIWFALALNWQTVTTWPGWIVAGIVCKSFVWGLL